MLTKEVVMPLLLEACPSFKTKWEEHINDICDRESDTILYTDFSAFARHIDDLVKMNSLDEFSAVFEVVERLNLVGDDFVKEAVVVGLLEDIQNKSLSEGMNLSFFERFLGPTSQKNWDLLIKSWTRE